MCVPLGTHHKTESFIRYALTDSTVDIEHSSQRFCFRQKRRGTWSTRGGRERVSDSYFRSAVRALARITGRGKRCDGHVHRGPIWKVECAPSQMRASTLSMVRWKRRSRCAFRVRRGRNERETLRESTGAGERAGLQKAIMRICGWVHTARVYDALAHARNWS
jgi:hypothetical protein